jgi:hypothetical protein
LLQLSKVVPVLYESYWDPLFIGLSNSQQRNVRC